MRNNRTFLAQFAATIAILGSAPACVLCSEDFPDACMEVFNNCDEDPGALLGYTLAELDMRESIVRTAEAPIGNLVADAFFDTAQRVCEQNEVQCPIAAIQNAGGIRSETACGERELIPLGPIYERDVNQILPFGSKLVITEINGYDLKLALEHSVDELGLPGQAGQSGHFLQVSRLRYKVDCTHATHAIDAHGLQILTQGARIIDLEIRNDVNSTTPSWE